MIDTRVKYNELNVNQLYYSVICGKISPIIIKSKLDDSKMMIYYPESSFETHAYYSDYGVIDCPNKRNNKLNCLFHTKEDADNYISTLDYNIELLLHKAKMNELDDLFYDLLD